MKVTIEEKKKEGKPVQRKITLDIGKAERLLTRKKGWQLPKDSAFELKDKKLVEKKSAPPASNKRKAKGNEKAEA